MRKLLPVRAMLTGVACAVVTLTGCSASATTEEPTLTKETIEKGITDALEDSVGQRPDSVECPGSLKAKVDESIRCELTAGTDRVGLTATVKSVEGTNAKYDVKVDDEVAK